MSPACRNAAERSNSPAGGRAKASPAGRWNALFGDTQRSRGVADDLKLGFAIEPRQKFVDPPENHVLEQILGTLRALEDRQALEDDDGPVAHLERQIRSGRLEISPTDGTLHAPCLLVFRSSCHSAGSGR